MENLTVEMAFLLGAAGAAAPEILRLYELRNHTEQFRWTWNYLFLTVPFLVLGGLVAVVLPATTVWGAFYSGLSLPVIISAAAKKAPTGSTGQIVTAADGSKVAKPERPLTGLQAYLNALI
jgi:hypothetical protein